METFSEDCLFSVQIKVPLAFFSKPFWHSGHPSVSFDRQHKSVLSVLHIFLKSITALPIVVCLDAMAYAGLCFWITLETQNSV